MIQLLDKKEAIQLYKEKIEKDFKEAYPNYSDFKKAIEKGLYKVYYYCEKNEPKAYFIIQEKEEILFVIWYAVFDQERGKGIGSKALRELKENMKKDILVEVENEQNKEKEENLKTIQRRINFYQKLGFHKIENIQYELKQRFYDLMIWGTKKEATQIKKILESCYDEVIQNKKDIRIEIIK